MDIVSLKKSPSLDQNGQAFIVDENGYKIPVMVVVFPDATAQTGLVDQAIENGKVSQVTNLQDAPVLTTPDDAKAPVVALAGMDEDGNVVPLSDVLQANSLAGKFQSAVQTGTGTSQNVAHGLGVVPSLVLVSIYDTNGVALPHAVTEGAHDATNVKVTVTSGVKFKVIALK